ncbi:MAG TPA: hypothetical protein VFK04_13140 [Gemmatimonadaceae bacterium]|nr:hypothetical protein [Gemmatimonadaceae bacterium]
MSEQTKCDCGKTLTPKEASLGKICDECYVLYRPGGPLSESPAATREDGGRPEGCICGTHSTTTGAMYTANDCLIHGREIVGVWVAAAEGCPVLVVTGQTADRLTAREAADMILSLRQQLAVAEDRVKRYAETLRDIRDNYDHDEDSHKYNTGCRVCLAITALCDAGESRRRWDEWGRAAEWAARSSAEGSEGYRHPTATNPENEKSAPEERPTQTIAITEVTNDDQ